MKNKVIGLLTFLIIFEVFASDEIPSKTGLYCSGPKIFPAEKDFFPVCIMITFSDHSVFHKQIDTIENFVFLLNKLYKESKNQDKNNKEQSHYKDYSAIAFYGGLYKTLVLFRKWSLDNKKMIPAIIENRNECYILLKNRKEISEFFDKNKHFRFPCEYLGDCILARDYYDYLKKNALRSWLIQ